MSLVGAQTLLRVTAGRKCYLHSITITTENTLVGAILIPHLLERLLGQNDDLHRVKGAKNGHTSICILESLFGLTLTAV